MAERLTLAKDDRASEVRKYAESSQFLFTILVKLGLSDDHNWDIPALEKKRMGRNVAAILTISLISSIFAAFLVVLGPRPMTDTFISVENFQRKASHVLGSSAFEWIFFYLATLVAQITVFAILFGKSKRATVHVLPGQAVLAIMFVVFFGGFTLNYATHFGAPILPAVCVAISCMAFSTWALAKLKSKHRGDGAAKEVD